MLLGASALMSAAGGLTGAVLNSYAGSPVLSSLFGGLLVFTGCMGLTGLSQKLRFHGAMAWAAGFLSGLLGGLVGNQGGIRSAAILGFNVPRDAFIATATVVGLIVDGARLPVYLFSQGSKIAALWQVLVAATLGAVAGTAIGERTLRRIPEPLCHKTLSALVLILGVFMLLKSTY